MANVKAESLEQVEQRHAKEQKELAKWQKELARPVPKNYFWILIVVLSLIYIVDEQTSSIISSLQSYIVCNLFNVKYPSLLELINKSNDVYNTALANLAIVDYIGYAIMLVLPFYKSLADKLGRRLFLTLNTCLMALGMLVIMVSPNIPIYIVGLLMINLVKTNDVQVMYIMEAAPQKHRAKLCGITKGIALASVSLLGVYRSVFIHQEVGEVVSKSWRNVFFIPVVFGLIIGALAIFKTRETPVFLKERISYLEKTDAQREADKADAKKHQSGVGPALKFIFSHKQLTWIAIVAALFFGCTGFTSYYESVSLQGLSDPGLVDTFIIVFPLFNALFTFFNGFIADKWGRRIACIAFGIFSFITFLLWIGSMYWFNTGTEFSGIFAGAMYGLSIGALWSFSDIVYLTMAAESSPTELRASVMGSISLMGLFGGMVGGIGIPICIGAGVEPWVACLCFFIPFMLASILIVIFKIKETKDVDMDTVTGCEWD